MMKLIPTMMIAFTLLLFTTSSLAQGWVSITSGTPDTLSSVTFPVADQVWASGDNGVILHSADGGLTWTPQESNNENNFLSISFVDALHGTATGGGGTILQSSDGGETWNVIQTDYWMAYHSSFQLGELVAFVAGQNTIFQPIVTWTTDAWETQDSGVFYINSNEGGARDVYAIDQDTIVCAVRLWDATGGIARSVNGGTEWTTVATSPGEQQGLTFNSSGIGISVGYGGTILRSTDYGASWTPIDSPVGGDLYDVDFADDSILFAVGDGGTIIKSDDGGLNWTQQEAGTGVSLYGVSFVDANRGVVVGMDGTILRTETGGEVTNEAPGAFEWLAPEADALLDRADPVIFQWTRSIDPDGDPITYSLEIVRTLDGHTIQEDVVDTVAVINLDDTELPDTAVDYIWTVRASDGQLQTEVTNGEGSFQLLPLNTIPDNNVDLPEGFGLSAAYPNPFNSMTIIRYHVNKTTDVRLTVYNLLGEEVIVLKKGRVTPGSHLAAWRGENSSGQKVTSGTYIVRMDANNQQTSLRVTYVK